MHRDLIEPNLRKYIPDNEGYVITDKATETMRANPLYLGKEADENDYFDIPEDTPLPEHEETEKNEQAGSEEL